MHNKWKPQGHKTVKGKLNVASGTYNALYQLARLATRAAAVALAWTLPGPSS
jgi:hypothetical protein